VKSNHNGTFYWNIAATNDEIYQVKRWQNDNHLLLARAVEQLDEEELCML
jgi:hypothetical protein